MKRVDIDLAGTHAIRHGSPLSAFGVIGVYPVVRGSGLPGEKRFTIPLMDSDELSWATV